MKNKAGIIVLALVAVVLAIALILVKKNATEQKQHDTSTIVTFSNNWVATSEKLDDQRRVNTDLEKIVEDQKQTGVALSNKLTTVSTTLQQTATTLSQTEASLKASQEETAKRDARINELEAANQELDKKALDLSNNITNLTQQIETTEKKLAASEGDKAFLEKQLKRLMAEKADLERQFNDLTVLRAQVAKLKEELNIARRIEWIRQGLFAATDQKGAQKLLKPIAAPQTTTVTNAKPAYNLNVEVSNDGSVKVLPPTTPATQTNPPVLR